jgi:hypothetical protein
MDALNMAAVNPPDPSRATIRSAGNEPVDGPLAPRLKAALGVLCHAHDYARDLNANPWDFATEISALRRLELSNSDLRWLVGRGLVEHGIEVTLGGAPERTFQHPPRLVLSKKTRFVLTTLGAELARRLARGEALTALVETRPATDHPALSIASPPGPPAPKWDRNRRELRIGLTVVKQFKIPSLGEETILAAFEEAHWAGRIDDPFPDDEEPSAKWRLQEAIEALNRNQKKPLVRFLGDGAGRGVRWEYAEAEAAHP